MSSGLPPTGADASLTSSPRSPAIPSSSSGTISSSTNLRLSTSSSSPSRSSSPIGSLRRPSSTRSSAAVAAESHGAYWSQAVRREKADPSLGPWASSQSAGSSSPRDGGRTPELGTTAYFEGPPGMSGTASSSTRGPSTLAKEIGAREGGEQIDAASKPWHVPLELLQSLYFDSTLGGGTVITSAGAASSSAAPGDVAKSSQAELAAKLLPAPCAGAGPSSVYIHERNTQTSYPPVRILPASQKLRILVTGGAGFVGSHLIDRLMLLGHEVICVDNFFTGSKGTLSHWVGHPNFEMLRHDVVNPLFAECDRVYQLACPASPRHYAANPVKTIKTSVLGTLNMLGLAKRTGARILLASTSEVYGDPDVSPQKETYNGNVNPTGPRACYDEGKRVAESLTYSYYYKDGVDVRVARIFNSFGPRMHPQDGRVVSNFILQGLRGEPYTIHGDGSQTRSFCFIHDLVDGLIALMERGEEEGVASDEDGGVVDVHSPVNIGNPHEFTIRELVGYVDEAIKELREEGVLDVPSAAAPSGESDQQPPIRYLPCPPDDPKQRKPDTTRAQQLLNWHPTWSLRDGLKEMTRYYAIRMKDGSL